MKILPTGIAVLEKDNCLSKWIEEQGRLDVDGRANEAAAKFIKPGDVVVDVGASLGDTTAAFLKAVGEDGKVYAFEPNPDAFEALTHNCPKAKCVSAGLGSDNNQRIFRAELGNAGASWLERNEVKVEVKIMRLDDLNLDRLDFLKIDVEGMEPLVLDGAIETIQRCKPVILMEVGRPVLARSGFSVEDVLARVESLGYRLELADERYGLEMDQTDVYLFPK